MPMQKPIPAHISPIHIYCNREILKGTHLMPYSIMLDAGHGGRDPGAVYNGRREKDDNLRITLAVGEILQSNDIDVLYTRTTDIYESPLQKATEANEAGVDFFVSIHRNSFPTDNVVSGVESLVYDLSGIKLEMGENINAQLEAINSNTDNALLDQNFDAVAQAIANGILMTINGGGAQNPDQADYTFRVQTGAFRNPVYANRMLNELLEQDFPAAISEGDGLFRVRVGQYANLDDASEMEQRLRLPDRHRAGVTCIAQSLRYAHNSNHKISSEIFFLLTNPHQKLMGIP